MTFPQAFALRMQAMLKDDYEAFVSSYDRPIFPALRLNPAKVPPNTALLPCITDAVPWAEGGYYYHPDTEPRPGKHPYHEAGVYYIQEASAMLPVSLFPPTSENRVLDLCAAPGSKTTQIAAAMQGGGLLVANEIHPQRAAILSQNVERMGLTNTVVTNHAPHELAEHFPAFFDRIFVDAPCSGEGMFRKEEQALSMWSENNVKLCASRQTEILLSAAKMLAPGGYLTHSTCTFAPEENEAIILQFLKSHPEFEVIAPKNPVVLACLEKGVIDRGNPDWVADGQEYAQALQNTLRLFPHHAGGEGHFAALLRKADHAPAEGNIQRSGERKKKREKERNGAAISFEKATRLFAQFAAEITEQVLSGTPLLLGDRLWLCPPEMPARSNGLRILRHGLHVGTLVNGDRFEPSHSLATALKAESLKKTFAVDLDTANSYLRGNPISCGEEKGWYLITLNGFALGWGKASGGMMKNHYPKGLRKQGS